MLFIIGLISLYKLNILYFFITIFTNLAFLVNFDTLKTVNLDNLKTLNLNKLKSIYLNIKPKNLKNF
jgi:hypothetical protein